MKLAFLLKNGRQKPACQRRDGTLFRARRQVNSHRSQMVFFFPVSKSITNVRTTAESFSYSKKQALNPQHWLHRRIILGALKITRRPIESDSGNGAWESVFIYSSPREDDVHSSELLLSNNPNRNCLYLFLLLLVLCHMTQKAKPCFSSCNFIIPHLDLCDFQIFRVRFSSPSLSIFQPQSHPKSPYD